MGGTRCTDGFRQPAALFYPKEILISSAVDACTQDF